MQKSIVIILSIVFFTAFIKNKKQAQSDNLFSSTMPDLFFFNANHVLKNHTLAVVNKNDTITLYNYDSLGRFQLFRRTKMSSRTVNFKYFSNTGFPIFKSVLTDYRLSFMGS